MLGRHWRQREREQHYTGAIKLEETKIFGIEEGFAYALYNSGMSKADQVKKIELGPGRKGRVL